MGLSGDAALTALEQTWVQRDVEAVEKIALHFPILLIDHGLDIGMVTEMHHIFTELYNLHSVFIVQIKTEAFLNKTSPPTCIDPCDREEIRNLREEWGAIIVLMGKASESVSKPVSDTIKFIIALVHEIGKSRVVPSLVVVTGGVYGPGDEEDPLAQLDSAHWGLQGLARTVGMELSGQGLRLVTMHSDQINNAAELVSQIVQELHTEDAVNEVMYRNARRFVPYVRVCRPLLVGPIRLIINERGTLDNLMLKNLISPVQPLAEGEVEVKVHTTSLNFRDVLNVLGLYPGDLGDPGNDLAGIVTKVGSQVNNVQVGDKVYGVAMSGSIKSFVRTRWEHISHIPKGLSFEDASTLPTVLLTVDLGLRQLAGLKKGERILIHSAAGGIGLAALHYAQRAGAEVFATASPEKHEFLRGLGINYLTASRDGKEFSREMRGMAGNQGLDVVLGGLYSFYSKIVKQIIFFEGTLDPVKGKQSKQVS